MSREVLPLPVHPCSRNPVRLFKLPDYFVTSVLAEYSALALNLLITSKINIFAILEYLAMVNHIYRANRPILFKRCTVYPYYGLSSVFRVDHLIPGRTSHSDGKVVPVRRPDDVRAAIMVKTIMNAITINVFALSSWVYSPLLIYPCL